MVNKDKKFIINEGRAITNGKFSYGGFPRILNEEGGATSNFQRGVATQPDDQENLTASEFGLQYPSSGYAKLARAFESAMDTARRAGYKIQGFQNKNAPIEHHEAFAAAQEAAMAAKAALEAHPEHAEFVKRKKAHHEDIVGPGLGN